MLKFVILTLIFRLTNSSSKTFRRYNQICHRENFHSVLPFLELQWTAARAVLNVTKLNTYEKEHESELHHKQTFYLQNKFYRFFSGMEIFNIQNSILAYARVFKCGNNNIRYNLQRFYMIQNRFPVSNLLYGTDNGFTGMIEFKFNVTSTNNNNKKHLYHYDRPSTIVIENLDDRNRKKIDQFKKKNWMMISDGNNNNNKNNQMTAKTFTFIRDPLERFESGLNEAFYRSDIKLSSSPLKSIAYIKSILEQILSYDTPNLDDSTPISNLFHIYPMSGVFFEYNIDILLHLESFEKDWKYLMKHVFELPLPSFDDQLGYHTTQKRSTNNDISKNLTTPTPTTASQYKRVLTSTSSSSLSNHNNHNFRTQFQQLIANDMSALHAICHMILIDYVCFPKYSLPVHCQHLNDSVIDIRSILLMGNYQRMLNKSNNNNNNSNKITKETNTRISSVQATAAIAMADKNQNDQSDGELIHTHLLFCYFLFVMTVVFMSTYTY